MTGQTRAPKKNEAAPESVAATTSNEQTAAAADDGPVKRSELKLLASQVNNISLRMAKQMLDAPASRTADDGELFNRDHPPAIYGAISAVMSDIDAIGKSRRADMGSGRGYNFRGIDDVYNELHEPMSKHGIFTAPRVLEDRTETRTSNYGTELIYRILRIRFRFYAKDGSYVDAVTIGEGMDSGDKASNKAMAVAHKYALMQVFAIPTEDPKDPENETHEVLPKFDENNPKHMAAVLAEAKTHGLPPVALTAKLRGGPASDDALNAAVAAMVAERKAAPPQTAAPAPATQQRPPQTAQAAAPAPAAPPLFDENNPKHMSWLEACCVKRNVLKQDQLDVLARMRGKAATGPIVAGCIDAHFAEKEPHYEPEGEQPPTE